MQISRLLSLYFKQTTALKNKIHGEDVLGNPSLLVVRSLKRSLKYKQKEIKSLEEKLTEIVKQDHQELLTRLESIPGLGRKTSIMLIVLTDGFERFTSASELCSYSGLTPIIRQSGTSVKGRSRISKMGNKKVRNLLFMCSFTACKNNKACKALYDRIVAKGKSIDFVFSTNAGKTIYVDVVTIDYDKSKYEEDKFESFLNKRIADKYKSKSIDLRIELQKEIYVYPILSGFTTEIIKEQAEYLINIRILFKTNYAEFF